MEGRKRNFEGGRGSLEKVDYMEKSNHLNLRRIKRKNKENAEEDREGEEQPFLERRGVRFGTDTGRARRKKIARKGRGQRNALLV